MTERQAPLTLSEAAAFRSADLDAVIKAGRHESAASWVHTRSTA